MKIVIMEPLGISAEKLAAVTEPLKAAGHEITAYDTKETDQAKLLERVKDANIIILANQPLSGDIIRQCPDLKFLSVAFTGVDHVEFAKIRPLDAINSEIDGRLARVPTGVHCKGIVA